MCLSYFRYRIKHVFVVHPIRISNCETLTFDVALNAFTNRKFTCTLANLSNISPRKAIRETSKRVDIDITSEWRLPQICLKNRKTRFFIGKRNVD
mmetsp:Transcript_551/g.1745  ORF Transcript_551/g.1745 Transcript_551/m.1745 type:complete len:95 (-) Transcript_551:2051-2335(-)